MQYALIDGKRREPHPGETGTCPICGHDVIARCGEINVWHWGNCTRMDIVPVTVDS